MKSLLSLSSLGFSLILVYLPTFVIQFFYADTIPAPARHRKNVTSCTYMPINRENISLYGHEAVCNKYINFYLIV